MKQRTTLPSVSFRNLLRSACILSLLAGLVSSCSLFPQPKCPEPEYLAFTPADKQWQNFSQGTRWLFQNQRGVQRTYRIAKVEHEEKRPYGTAVFVERTDYYLDYWYMTWVVDSTSAPAGYLLLKRMPPDSYHHANYLYYEVSWNDFLGFMNFGPDLAAAKFSSLTIRGLTYTHVNSFTIGTATPVYGTPQGKPQQTKQIDYDQQAGVIRFITLNGDVWERMP